MTPESSTAQQYIAQSTSVAYAEELSYSESAWSELRAIASCVSTSRQVLKEQKAALEKALSGTQQHVDWDHMVSMQTKRVMLVLLEQRTNSTRQRIRHLRNRLTAAKELEVTGDKELETVRKATALDAQLARDAYLELCAMRSLAKKLGNELLLRRQLMLHELRRIFIFQSGLQGITAVLERFLDISGVTALPPHPGSTTPPPRGSALDFDRCPESELYAAAGYTVNFLDCASRIFDLPLRHPTCFQSSRSMMLHRLTDERFNLFNAAKRGQGKKSREMLLTAFAMLNEDCAVFMRVADHNGLAHLVQLPDG